MTAKIRSTPPRWVYVSIGFCLVVFIVYSLIWRAGAGQMHQAVEDWIDDQRMNGLIVETDDIKIRGYPFFLRAMISNPIIEAPASWRWEGQTLAIDALPYDVNRLIFSVIGKQAVSIQGGGDFHIEGASIRASIKNDKQRGWAFSATIDDTKITEAVTRQATRRQTPSREGGTVSLEHFVMDVAPRMGELSTLTVNLAAQHIAGEIQDRNLDLDRIEATIAISQMPLLTENDDAEHALQAWAKANGTVSVARFFTQINEATFACAGTLTLDGAHNPEGAFETELVQPAIFVNAATGAGLISAQKAEQLSASLTLMSIASGGKVSAPITIKDGAINAANLPIGNATF